ncbi:hypothetical protein [Salinibacillus xinjiangensis]|uniref:Uncharacterized protein n=1 Tax=Salinibacillus xinjiangensis TaxID=1229268 RepID=A0A6G1X8P2_9BACI|nr:hypothetical protein [Salinibacillus xinjiangensis]MRG87373.1 hypothetical protein [Salinibacillus xinjiangensis]
MVYFNNRVEPQLYSNPRHQITQNQGYFYHNRLLYYMDKLEKTSKEGFNHIGKKVDEINSKQDKFLFSLWEIRKMQRDYENRKRIELENVTDVIQNMGEKQRKTGANQLEHFMTKFAQENEKQRKDLEQKLEVIDARLREKETNEAKEINHLVEKQEAAEQNRLEHQEQISSQLEDLKKIQNQSVKSSQAIVKLLRSLSVGKPVDSITVRGHQIPLKRLISYEQETDLATFLQEDGNIVIADAHQIVAITFPTT